jgi:hypothetical protein
MLKSFRQRAAQKRLAQITEDSKAANATWKANRDRQLTGDRKAHIAAVMSGFIRPRSTGAK